MGVGGGVPHYTDYSKHVRLGDVVVSHPNNDKKKYVYTYCGYVRCGDAEGDFQFETKEYCPNNLILQDIAAQLKSQVPLHFDIEFFFYFTVARSVIVIDHFLSQEEQSVPWMQYLNEGLKGITSSELEQDFARPDAETDKLFMSIGERDIIEVAHPSPADGVCKR